MDFNTILTQQYNYINSLINIIGPNPANASTKLSQINQQLNNLDQQLNSSDSQAVLTRQSDMQSIINSETIRLQTKQNSIDQAMQSQSRLVDLNQSYSNRYADYNIIIIIIVVALVLFLGISFIQPMIDFLPDWIFTSLIVIIFSVAFIYSIIIYTNIQYRSNMDHNVLDLSTPKPLTPDEVAAQTAANVAAGNLLASQNLSGCTGSSCCGNGSIWDISSQLCIIPDSFATLGNTKYSTASPFSVSEYSTASPFSVSEYSSYAPV